MTDFIVHIGIEKTGTSTLQSHFFSHLPNYLGISKNRHCLSNSNYELRWFFNLFKKFVHGMNINQESSQFCHHIRSLQKSKGSPNNSIVLSYEQLCTPVLNNVLSFPFLQYNEYDFTTFPIIRFLNYLSNYIWSYGHFRVL